MRLFGTFKRRSSKSSKLDNAKVAGSRSLLQIEFWRARSIKATDRVRVIGYELLQLREQTKADHQNVSEAAVRLYLFALD
jgi:hypothetical protein